MKPKKISVNPHYPRHPCSINPYTNLKAALKKPIVKMCLDMSASTGIRPKLNLSFMTDAPAAVNLPPSVDGRKDACAGSLGPPAS
jgi:hypothetical protein